MSKSKSILRWGRLQSHHRLLLGVTAGAVCVLVVAVLTLSDAVTDRCVPDIASNSGVRLPRRHLSAAIRELLVAPLDSAYLVSVRHAFRSEFGPCANVRLADAINSGIPASRDHALALIEADSALAPLCVDRIKAWSADLSSPMNSVSATGILLSLGVDKEVGVSRLLAAIDQQSGTVAANSAARLASLGIGATSVAEQLLDYVGGCRRHPDVQPGIGVAAIVVSPYRRVDWCGAVLHPLESCSADAPRLLPRVVAILASRESDSAALIRLLASWRAEAAGAVDEILSFQASEDPEVRLAVAIALRDIPVRSDRVARAIARLAADSDLEIRQMGTQLQARTGR